ncbi:hypothetical protein [Streptomyces sp. NPDC000880]
MSLIGTRPASVLTAGFALLAASAGDFAQGYDGPGPFIFLVAGLVVLLVPWRQIAWLAVATSLFFLVGAIVNFGDLEGALESAEVFPVIGVVVQLAGFVVSGVAGLFALGKRRPGTERSPARRQRV